MFEYFRLQHNTSLSQDKILGGSEFGDFYLSCSPESSTKGGELQAFNGSGHFQSSDRDFMIILLWPESWHLCLLQWYRCTINSPRAICQCPWCSLLHSCTFYDPCKHSPEQPYKSLISSSYVTKIYGAQASTICDKLSPFQIDSYRYWVGIKYSFVI